MEGESRPALEIEKSTEAIEELIIISRLILRTGFIAFTPHQYLTVNSKTKKNLR